MRERLLEVEALTREHYDTGMELVPTVLQRCPCGERMEREVIRQDALLRHGGYGGTQRIETDVCPQCGTTRPVAVATERPPR